MSNVKTIENKQNKKNHLQEHPSAILFLLPLEPGGEEGESKLGSVQRRGAQMSLPVLRAPPVDQMQDLSRDLLL